MGFLRRTETPTDDHARTGDPVNGGDLTPFEEVVLEGAMPLPGDPYPPPGHTYPRR